MNEDEETIGSIGEPLPKRKRSLARLGITVAACLAVVVVCFTVLFGLGATGQEATPIQPENPPSSFVAPDEGRTGPDDEGQAPAYQSEDLGDHEEGVVLVDLGDGVSTQDALDAFANHEELAGISVADDSSSYVELLLPASLSVERALELLPDTGVVAEAQPNYYYYPVDEETGELIRSSDTSSGELAAAVLPDGIFAGEDEEGEELEEDEELSIQSSRNDSYFGKQWGLQSANVPTAWDYVSANYDGSTKGNPIVIAVIDQGFFLGHRDLDSSRIVGAYNAGYGDTTLGRADVSHGTHVLGIIGATSGNGLDIAGAADNRCQLMPIEASGPSSSGGSGITTKTLVNSIEHVIKQKQAGVNVRVINMSIGAYVGNSFTSNDIWVRNTITQAYNNGILTVAAACNQDANSGYYVPYKAMPSDFENVLSVINVEKDTTAPEGVVRSSSSNFNTPDQDTKNISAPGTNIYSLGRSGTSTSSVVSKTGTSMASPLVAAIVGLMYTVEPDLTPQQAFDTVCSTAKDITPPGLGWDRQTGHGLVDAYAAVRAADQTASAPVPYMEGIFSTVKGYSTTLQVMEGGVLASGYSWTSSNPSVATVTVNANGTATVRGVGGGQTIITATKGNYRLRQTVQVSDISGSTSLFAGQTYSYRISPLDDGSWYWSLSNTTYASINAYTGTVTTKTASSGQRVTLNVIARSIDPYGGVTKTLTRTVTLTLSVQTTPVYRMYNPNSGEHHYTTTASERDMLQYQHGWKYEGVAWNAPVSGSPVYRMYNPFNGEHHYTTSASERDTLRLQHGWIYEGVGWQSAGSKNIYRLYNPNASVFTHHYTADASEREMLRRNMWVYEGIGWYGY